MLLLSGQEVFEVFDDAREREPLCCGGPDQLDDFARLPALMSPPGEAIASEESQMIGNLLDARRRRHEVQPLVIGASPVESIPDCLAVVGRETLAEPAHETRIVLRIA